jgi:predicted TPR repeat methyltransferase
MQYQDKIYAHYRSCFKGEIDEAGLRFTSNKLRPLVAPWVASLDRTLPAVDLGCGSGELLYALRELGFSNIHGCDLSAEQVAVARRAFPLVQEANLFDYLAAFEDESLGLVTAFDVIEHLGPQASFDLMDLVRRKLSPGGLFIAHLPNGSSPFVGHVFWGDMTHRWCLTPQSAATFCQLNGFSDFAACEHLGESASWKGRVRSLLWRVVRAGLRAYNRVETGSSGGDIWTRNFAFKARKLAAPVRS